MAESRPDTASRKQDHIRIALEEDVQAKGITTGFDAYRFTHQALPELDLADIDTRCHILERILRPPC